MLSITELNPTPPPAPAAPDPVISAVDEALAVITEAEELHRRLMLLNIPRGGDPAIRLHELKRLWTTLGVGKPTRRDAERRAQLFVAKLENNKHLHANGVSLLLNRALDQMEELLSSGANDAAHPVLSRRDFGTGLLTLENGGLLAGRYDSLPADHFAREWVVQEDLYSLNCPHCLILSDIKDRQVYFERNEVVGLTRMWKTHQRRHEAESVKVEQEKVRLRTIEWEESHRVEMLQARVEQLEKEKRDAALLQCSSSNTSKE